MPSVKAYRSFIFLALFPFLLQANNCQRMMTVAVGDNQPPYKMEHQGDLTGIDVDIVREILEQANICVSFREVPSIDRALAELRTGRIDILLAASFTAERNKYAHYSTPYRDETIRIFWKPSKDDKLINGDVETFFNANLLGLVNKKSYFGPKITELLSRTDNSSTIISVQHFNARMEMLSKDKVNFTIEDEYSGKYFIREHGLKELKMHPYVVHQNKVSLLFSRKTVSSTQVEKINQVIVQNDGKITKIIKSYSTNEINKQLTPVARNND